MLTSGSDIAKYALNLKVPMLDTSDMIHVDITNFTDVPELQLMKLASKNINNEEVKISFGVGHGGSNTDDEEPLANFDPNDPYISEPRH